MHPDVIILTVARIAAWLIAIGSFSGSVLSLGGANQIAISNGLLFSIAALLFLIATKGATRIEPPSE